MTEAITALGGGIQMPTPTATKPALLSRAVHGNAPTEAKVIEISGGGRTAVGDRRPAAKPAAPAASPTPAPAAAKPAKMGCSGYRSKHGTSDEAIVKAIREHAAKSVAETADSPWITATNLTDEQLLDVIGWSVLAKTACAKVAEHLSDMSG
jgi:pyruvate/2-oxoglutarate dehydrogenase complex dihydrolipoamide acyltransferase (E2) component